MYRCGWGRSLGLLNTVNMPKSYLELALELQRKLNELSASTPYTLLDIFSDYSHLLDQLAQRDAKVGDDKFVWHREELDEIYKEIRKKEDIYGYRILQGAVQHLIWNLTSEEDSGS